MQALAARQLFASLSLTLAMSGAGCSGPSGGMDVPLGMSDALVFPEVSIDVPGTRLYFQRCRENADCPGVAPNGAREICDRSFPGGMCRVVSCADNAPCGPLGVCARQRGCLPRCDLNSDLCTAYSGLCLSFNLPAAENAACFSVCDPAVPGEPADSRIPVEMGPRRCRGGLRCDPYQNRCLEMPRTTGVENGSPCRADSQCRSDRCIPEVDSQFGPRLTGFLGGYCISEAPLPTEAVFQAARGSALPTSTCPPNSAILPPTDAMQSPGSAARCLRACMTDVDCRGGYRCEQPTDMMGAPLYTNGACVPLDCSRPNAQCPAGTMCVASAAADAGVLFTGSRCLGQPSDGGLADAAVDASVVDGAMPQDAAVDAGTDAADASDAMMNQ